jgi:hypothetical protein
MISKYSNGKRKEIIGMIRGGLENLYYNKPGMTARLNRLKKYLDQLEQTR